MDKKTIVKLIVTSLMELLINPSGLKVPSITGLSPKDYCPSFKPASAEELQKLSTLDVDPKKYEYVKIPDYEELRKAITDRVRAGEKRIDVINDIQQKHELFMKTAVESAKKRGHEIIPYSERFVPEIKE